MKRNHISIPIIAMPKKGRYFHFLSLLAFALSFVSCGNDDDIFQSNFDYNTLNDGIPDNVKYFTNAPYPTHASTLRILAIGSSFTNDATYYLDALIKASGIDMQRLGIYKLVTGFARFDTWIDTWKSQETVYLDKVSGNIEMGTYGTLQEVLLQDWDVIVISQASDASYKWATFASLKEYMEIIYNACPNKNVCLAYQLQWSHTPGEMPYVMQGNTACSQKMTQRYGIDIIIPCGTAIQVARGTSLNDSKYLTRDRYHLNYGIGCYIASCTWFQQLLRPVFGNTIVGNSAKPDGSYSQEEIELSQRCAEYAVENPYDYTHIIH